MPVTHAEIINAKPREQPYRLFDGRGLYLEVAPSGGRWWRFKYRFKGKEKRLSLGVFPEVSIEAARDRLDDVRRRLAAGIDPADERRSNGTTRRANRSIPAITTTSAATRSSMARSFCDTARKILRPSPTAKDQRSVGRLLMTNSSLGTHGLRGFTGFTARLDSIRPNRIIPNRSHSLRCRTNRRSRMFGSG